MDGLMDIFGGGDVYGDLLSEDQKKRLQQQTMMTMAAKLLQAGGPSTTPTNLGQALGGAFLSGQEAYGKAGQNALQGMLTKQKIDEYRRDALTKQRVQEILSGQRPGQMGAPTQAQTPLPSQITLGATPQASVPGMRPAGLPQQNSPQGAAPLNQSQQMISRLTEVGQGIMGYNPQQGLQFLNAAKSLQDMSSQGPTRTLSPEEVAQMRLPPGTIAQVTANNDIKIVRAPNMQTVQTPQGGTALINLDAIALGQSAAPQARQSAAGQGATAPELQIPATPAVQRAAKSPAVPQSQGTTARASVAQGVTPLFDPALKPEQLITESRDWTKNYYQPVQTIIKNYQDVLELINSGSGGISDYGILIKAIKALDPTSAVMQGEADSAKNMMSLADRMSSILKQVESGGLGSDVAREQLANLARASVKTAVTSYNSQLGRQKAIYSAGYMPQGAIDAILSPIEMPAGAESMGAMRQQITPAAPTYPPNVMSAMESGLNVQSDGRGNFIYLDPNTNSWKPIQ